MYMENASGINNKIPGLSGKSRKARAGCHELRVGRRNARATLRLLDQEGDENCPLSCLRIKTAKSRTKIGRGNLNLNQRLFWSSYVATFCTCLTSVCVPPHGSQKSALFRLLAGEAVAAGIGQQIYDTIYIIMVRALQLAWAPPECRRSQWLSPALGCAGAPVSFASRHVYCGQERHRAAIPIRLSRQAATA